jgi:hypothetical protein
MAIRSLTDDTPPLAAAVLVLNAKQRETRQQINELEDLEAHLAAAVDAVEEAFNK